MAKKKKQPTNTRDRLWIEAKRLCRLNDEDVRTAKEMGLNPRSLIKNIPSKSQQWKLPVKVWIHEMYEKRQGKTAKKKARKERAIATNSAADTKQLPEDITAYLDDECFVFEEGDDMPSSQDVQDENQAMLHRQRQFRIAAQYIAGSLSGIPEVQKIVLFGSVAKPLKKEVPRFSRFRRAGIAINHECQDVDIAVWLCDLSCLKAIQKVRSQALNELLAEREIGVTHHQVDIFIMEPKTDRYLGRLCTFGSCPKGKDKYRVFNCGKPEFLQQHEDFKFDSKDLSVETSIILFERVQKNYL